MVEADRAAITSSHRAKGGKVMDTGSSNTVALAVVTMEAATINKDHAHHPRSNTANNSKINILPTIIPALGKVEVPTSVSDFSLLRWPGLAASCREAKQVWQF